MQEYGVLDKTNKINLKGGGYQQAFISIFTHWKKKFQIGSFLEQERFDMQADSLFIEILFNMDL